MALLRAVLAVVVVTTSGLLASSAGADEGETTAVDAPTPEAVVVSAELELDLSAADPANSSVSAPESGALTLENAEESTSATTVVVAEEVEQPAGVVQDASIVVDDQSSVTLQQAVLRFTVDVVDAVEGVADAVGAAPQQSVEQTANVVALNGANLTVAQRALLVDLGEALVRTAQPSAGPQPSATGSAAESRVSQRLDVVASGPLDVGVEQDALLVHVGAAAAALGQLLTASDLPGQPGAVAVGDGSHSTVTQIIVARPTTDSELSQGALVVSSGTATAQNGGDAVSWNQEQTLDAAAAADLVTAVLAAVDELLASQQLELTGGTDTWAVRLEIADDLLVDTTTPGVEHTRSNTSVRIQLARIVPLPADGETVPAAPLPEVASANLQAVLGALPVATVTGVGDPAEAGTSAATGTTGVTLVCQAIGDATACAVMPDTGVQPDPGGGAGSNGGEPAGGEGDATAPAAAIAANAVNLRLRALSSSPAVVTELARTGEPLRRELALGLGIIGVGLAFVLLAEDHALRRGVVAATTSHQR